MKRFLTLMILAGLLATGALAQVGNGETRSTPETSHATTTRHQAGMKRVGRRHHKRQARHARRHHRRRKHVS